MNVWVVTSFDMRSWLPKWHGIYLTEDLADSAARELRIRVPDLDVTVESWEVGG